ncbi:hypothetical protein DCAR_0417990 [Daucus carota subsp. sativus]|uniref:RING-type E3 ubiquitin transferase n=1 Tax=Daucus carota subsp. sativus TaxID=79200 RepID=A0AAF0X111_DAUCS|nr:PREDICTED: uncharacterized protein LOC108217495 [Daucus carota subsp. sativus]WOG98646.1 hypothetical protein DCAR_0417990 [Daucus carota subsp. sativus]
MSSFWQCASPHTCIFVLLILFKITTSTSKSSSVSYSEQCASVIPEATPTTYAYVTFPSLQTSTSFFSGVERIFGKNSSQDSPISFNFQSSRNVYATNSPGVYKIDAELTFQVYNHMYFPASNSSDGKSSPRRRRSGILKFVLSGFWSESSGKGCFVGDAPWYSSAGEPLDLEAVFMIKYSKSSIYSNGFVSGELKSLSHLNDEAYFEPISILSFPRVNEYEYQLISEETLRGFYVFEDDEKYSVLGSHPRTICSFFDRNYVTFRLEYASSCSSSLKSCSPLDGVPGIRPTYVSLYSIQCYECGNKMRFLVQLTNRSYVGRDDMFDPSTTLVGEGMWDEAKNRLVIVACRILSSGSLEDTRVGDCSFRLSLYFPSLWSLKNREKAVGQIWTNKTAQDVGYFDRIKFRTSDAYIRIPGFTYQYTEIGKVNKLCPKKALTKGESFPSGKSSAMRFDSSVPNSAYFVWNSAAPVFIGNDLYAESRVQFENVVSDNAPMNVSYKITFSPARGLILEPGLSSLNTSLDSYGQLIISAEGVYDAGTGYLCMVGCRDLPSNNSLDCDIVLTFQFPGSSKTKEGFISGSMHSTRNQSDPLFFEHLNMTTSFSISSESPRSIWRIDLETSIVLIPDTVACIFVLFQLYHVRRYPDTLPSVSLLMLVILTLGHVISLGLNFEAVFMTKRNTYNTMFISSGWLVVNEEIVKLITLAVFLVQSHLIRLAWTARQSGENNPQAISAAERKTFIVFLPLYLAGGLIAFFVNSNKNPFGNAPPTFDYPQAHRHQHRARGDLKAYASLILDGFLFPRVLLNMF